MLSTRVNKIGKPQLPDTVKPLEIGMLDQIINQCSGNGNKTVNGVVDDFSFVQKNYFERKERKLSNQSLSPIFKQ